MTPQNSELLSLLRDVSQRVDTSHREVLSELKEVRQQLDQRLDEVEDKVSANQRRIDKHDHFFHSAFTVAKWVIPSGGFAAVVAWIVSISQGQAK